MGISVKKGNGGYLGFDARANVTSSIGIISLRKARLERLGGDLEPVFPSNFLFEDTFATGDLSKWTTANQSSTKKWMVGTSTKGTGTSLVTIPSGSTYAAYITDDGTDNHYTVNTNCHMYFDFTIPTGTTSLTLSFQWMCTGENASAAGSFDFGYIMFASSRFNPSAGTEYSALTLDEGDDKYARLIVGNITGNDRNDNNGKFNSNNSSARVENNGASNAFVEENMTISETVLEELEAPEGLWSTTQERRLIFSFTSDGSVQNDPAWTIANVRLKVNE